jgi:hypothetical protein
MPIRIGDVLREKAMQDNSIELPTSHEHEVYKAESECKARRMITLTTAQVRNLVFGEERIGYCTSCGGEIEGVEPDCTNRKCPFCSQNAVCGIDSLILGEYVDFIE